MVEALAEVADYRDRFVNFLKSFQDRKGTYKYRESLSSMASEGRLSLVIDFDDLITFDADLASDLRDKPLEIVPKASLAVHDAMRVENMQYAAKVKGFKARFRRLDEVVPLRALKSHQMGRLLMVEGIITRASAIKQLLKVAVYQCPRCDNKMTVEQSGNIQQMPPQCSNPDCGRKGFFRLVPEESTFTDYQMISLQEKPEELPPGQLPRSLEAVLQGDLVDVSRPGDRISLVGTLLAKQEFTAKGFRLATFSTGIEANHLEVSEKGSEEVQITAEDEKVIKELAKDPSLYQKIISSVAPSIYGFEEIKEAVAYQLAGGVPKIMPDGIKIRGDVNILLVGDPGTAKSQLLQYVSRIAPRGVYTSGKGSTAAGLTATVVRDKNTNEFFLEAGALVLADKGLASIDEIDKMRQEDRSAIHEAMEQQSYHPSFEFTLSDGSRHKIGSFVDGLFDRYPRRKVHGVNCEIIDTHDLGYRILSTDFRKIFRSRIDRVSRHRSPDHFIKITYSNGRSILVTPEHPVYVFRKGQITTVDASNIGEGDFAPAPRNLAYESMSELVTAVTEGGKQITLPNSMDHGLANFRGFSLPEGYGYSGSPKLSSFNRSRISCAENNGHSESLHSSTRDDEELKNEDDLQDFQRDAGYLNLLCGLRWLRVTKTEEISNAGAYKTSFVYDVTVEPNHNFISHGIVLHNTISIAKAGIVVQLNARSSILAAANPTFGRYVTQKTVAENISELPVTILSRFDLIFTILDRPDEARDREMTEHILNLHRGIQREKESPIHPQLLKKYLYYIRKNAAPKLSEEASASIEKFFLGMRSRGDTADSPVPIGMRQLEAAVRLSEARAKLALKEEVTKDDVEAVVKLLKSFLMQVGMDQTTGKLDIDIINVGRAKSASDKLSAIFDLLIAMERENEGGPIRKEAFLERADVEGLGRGFAEKALGQWLNDGIIYEPKAGFIKKT
jgi:DNA replicative helicase MCM subunit Mcm2 (Cdc46/Mcm family)